MSASSRVLLLAVWLGCAVGCIDFDQEQADFCLRNPTHCGLPSSTADGGSEPPDGSVPSSAPTLGESFQSASSATAGDTVTFRISAQDSHGGSLRFGWSANTGTLGSVENTATSSQVVWTSPACAPPDTTPSITATATNERGLSSSITFQVTIHCARWTPAGQMGTARFHHTTTELPSGKVLVVGGTNGGLSLASAELYDPATDTWTATGSMALPRSRYTATLLPSGKVLVAGGYGGSTGSAYLANAEVYDPATGTWTATGSMTLPRSRHTATLLSSGKVLVTGGIGPTYRDTAELYDPALGTWTATGSMVAPRSSHTASLLASGEVLVAGGYTGSAFLDSAEVYNPATGAWSSTGRMGSLRHEHTATVLPEGQVLVAGGRDSSASLSRAEVYEPATGTWTATGSLASARNGHTATVLSGKVLVVGGISDSTGLSGVEVYNPATGVWTLLQSMASPRFWHTASVLPSGELLVTGGTADGNVPLSTAELHGP